MNINPNIELFQIKDIPYLLPFGQGVADHILGTSVNEIGMDIWNLLQSSPSEDALLKELAALYEVTEEEYPGFESDILAYLDTLKNYGFLEDSSKDLPSPFTAHTVTIGPLSISLQIPENVYQNYFLPFAAAKTPVPSSIHQDLQFFPYRPSHSPCGQILVRSEEILISDYGDSYLFLPMKSENIFEIHCSKDGKYAKIYGKSYATLECAEEIFHAIRFPFLVAAQENGLCLLHSASLLHKGKAILFSGHSGAGKSTHTNLWHHQFGTPFLNGDLNMIGLKDGKPVCYGLPWCGTSGIFTTEEYPLGAVVFLKQAPRNKVTIPSPDQKVIFLMQRLITPGWTKKQVASNLSLSESITNTAAIFRLECTKDPDAAILMRDTIDTSSSASCV